MRSRVFAGLLLFSLFALAGGAQSPTEDKPVWTMEIIKAKAGQFGPMLGYLDNNWMRVREEAQREGAVLTYHRIAERQTGAQNDGTVILLTEFKNQKAYDEREKLFTSILNRLQNTPTGVVMLDRKENLYDTLSTTVFDDYSDPASVRFRLLAQN
jgi:hypothetical protein